MWQDPIVAEVLCRQLVAKVRQPRLLLATSAQAECGRSVSLRTEAPLLPLNSNSLLRYHRRRRLK